MLSIQILRGSGCVAYYKKHATENYYANDLAQPGEWYGCGAVKLGLTGNLRGDDFDRALQGYGPGGDFPLVQNAGHPNRVLGWDLTFSAPKSVSVLWALAPEDIRRTIEAAHRAAVIKALDQVQSSAAITRRGKGGCIHERGELVFALFQDGVSRALDPQLHTHCVTLNLAVRADRTVGALHSRPIFDQKMALGAQYQAELAAQLHQQLRLAMQSEPPSFRILGVPQELCDQFSKRRREILRHMRERGTAGAVAAKVATLATRPRKQDLAPEEVRAGWQEVGRQFGWTEEQVRQLVSQAQRAAQPPQERTAQEPSHEPSAERPKESEPAKPIHGVAGDAGQPHAQRTDQGRHELPPPEGREESGSRGRSNAGAGRHEQARGASAGQQHGPGGQRSDDSFRPGADRGEAEPGPTSPREKEAGARKRNPYPKSWLRWEWRAPFGKAPSWSPTRKIKLPRLVVGRPHLKSWGKVRWHLDLGIAEFRLQNRRMFRKAPHWSGLRWIEPPALRLALKPAAKPEDKWGEIRRQWHLPLGELRVQQCRVLENMGMHFTPATTISSGGAVCQKIIRAR